MSGIIYLIVTILAAFLIVRRLGASVFRSGIESLAVSAPAGIAGVSLLASGLAIFMSQGTAAWAALGLLVAGAVICAKGAKFWPTWETDRREKLWTAAVIAVVAVFLTGLALGTLHLNGDGSISIAKQASVDVVYHLSQMERVAQATNWHAEEPNFAGEFIRYPYLINLFSGVMLKFGAPLSVAYHTPIILLMLALLFAFLRLGRELGLGKTGTLAVLAMTFFGSGLAYALGYDFNTGPLAVTYPHQHIDFTGFVAGFFSVQRAFVLGLPLLLFSVLSFFRGIKEDNLAALKWAGVLFGLLPLAHSHSFIAGGVFYGAALLYYIVRRNPVAYDLVRGLVFYGTFIAIVPLICILVLPAHNLGGVPAVRLGWMTSPTEVGGLVLPSLNSPRLIPWVMFMLGNFGALLLLPILALAGWRRKLGDIYWVTLLAALALWIFPNLVQVQTWDYDTNKFFTYAILFSAVAAVMVVRSWQGRAKVAGVTVLVLVTLSSLPIPVLKLRHMLTVEQQQRVTMFTQEQQQAAAWIKQNSWEDDAILSSAANPDPDSLLNGAVIGSGRPATVGYITWLYTHGIDYEERLQHVQKFFQTGQPADLADAPAEFLVIDPVLSKQYPALASQLSAAGLNPAYKSSNISIYKLK